MQPHKCSLLVNKIILWNVDRDKPAGTQFSLRFCCFPVLFLAQATSSWRKLFMSNSSGTYSRDVLLNIRVEIARVLYFFPAVGRADE